MLPLSSSSSAIPTTTTTTTFVRQQRMPNELLREMAQCMPMSWFVGGSKARQHRHGIVQLGNALGIYLCSIHRKFAKVVKKMSQRFNLLEAKQLELQKELLQMQNQLNNTTDPEQRDSLQLDIAVNRAGYEFIVQQRQKVLPEGSTSQSLELREEIFIPAIGDSNKTFLDSFPRVQIDTLDNICKQLFEGFTSLNVIQSQMYDKVYNSLDNVLICAPTGAGKTNIALLAVAKTIKDNVMKNVWINKSAFKIVYLAPKKALATEMTANFSKRLSKLGLKVRELTGDAQLTKREINETQLFIMTPKEWEVLSWDLIQKADDKEFAPLMRLVIIDKVHLYDDRGTVIESIMARTLRLVEVYRQNLRIVGLSATLPNFDDVARFLRVDPKRGLFNFDASFRPVPLALSFLGVRDSDRQAVVLQREREKALHRGEKPPTKVPQKQMMTQREKMDERRYLPECSTSQSLEEGDTRRSSSEMCADYLSATDDPNTAFLRLLDDVDVCILNDFHAEDVDEYTCWATNQFGTRSTRAQPKLSSTIPASRKRRMPYEGETAADCEGLKRHRLLDTSTAERVLLTTTSSGAVVSPRSWPRSALIDEGNKQSDVADTKCQGQAQSKYPCPFEHCTKGYKNLSTLKTHVEDKHRGPVDMWEFVRQNTKDLHNNLKPNMIGIKSDGNPFML